MQQYVPISRKKLPKTPQKKSSRSCGSQKVFSVFPPMVQGEGEIQEHVQGMGVVHDQVQGMHEQVHGVEEMHERVQVDGEVHEQVQNGNGMQSYFMG